VVEPDRSVKMRFACQNIKTSTQTSS